MHLNCLARSRNGLALDRLLRWALRIGACSLAAGAAMAGDVRHRRADRRPSLRILALDERRSVVYVANYTANRIDVISTKTNALVKSASINVAAQPSSLALSPNGRYLVITHLSNFKSPQSRANGVDDHRPDAEHAADVQPSGRRRWALPSATTGWRWW